MAKLNAARYTHASIFLADNIYEDGGLGEGDNLVTAAHLQKQITQIMK